MSKTSWCRSGETECGHCHYVNEWPAEYSRPWTAGPAEGEKMECADCFATLTCAGHDIFDAQDGVSPSGAWIWEATPLPEKTTPGVEPKGGEV